MNDITKSLKMILEGTYIDLQTEVSLLESNNKEYIQEFALHNKSIPSTQEIFEMTKRLENTERLIEIIKNNPHNIKNPEAELEKLNNQAEWMRWYLSKKRFAQNTPDHIY